MFEKGQILENKYEIIEHIGTGGGGIVYKATQLGLNRFVAIKQIKNEVIGVLEDKGEADVLKDLKNNYIPTVFDFINNNGQTYTVMEYVEGQSFQQLLDEGKKFSQQKILKYACQLCEAVAYLHSRKRPVIHSDIKPANIMLTSEDNICLIDYNISLFVDGNENAIGVSDGYSPPEQYGIAVFDADKTISGTMIDNNTVVSISDMEMLIDSATPSAGSDNETLIDKNTAKDIFGTKMLIDNAELPVSPNSETLIDNNYGYTKALIESPEPNPIKTMIDEVTPEPKLVQESSSAVVKRKVDKQSDIYSIGASLYHIALGKRPAVSTGNVVPLSNVDSRISESFAAIIDKAMQKNPAKRFHSAEQMLKALNNLRRYDRRYKNMLIRQEIAALVVILAMAVSSLTAVMGYMRLSDEDIVKYDMLVAEMDNSDITEAEKYCNEASEIFPERAEAYEKMAMLIYKSGDYVSAAEYIEKAISLGTLYIGESNEKYSFGKLYYILGRCYMEIDEYSLSAEALEKAVSSDNDEISYYCDYAAALAQCGESEKAEKILDIAVQKGLSDANILFVKGEIEFAKKNYAESIKNIKDCIAAVPDEDYIYRAYMIGANAYSLEYANNHELGMERIEFLNDAVNILPVEKVRPFYEMLAKTYIDEANNSQSDMYLTEALKTYEKINSQGWGTASVNYQMIRLYRRIGNFKYAKEYAEKILDQNGDDYEIYKLLAFLESDLQNQKNNSDRDYSDFCVYYEKAAALCTDDEDSEMQLLADAYKNARERKK